MDWDRESSCFPELHPPPPVPALFVGRENRYVFNLIHSNFPPKNRLANPRPLKLDADHVKVLVFLQMKSKACLIYTTDAADE